MSTTLPLTTDVEARLRAWSEEIDGEMAGLVVDEVDDTAMRRAVGCHLGWLHHGFAPLPEERDVMTPDRLAGTLAVLCHHAAATEPRRTGQVPNLLPFAAAVELLHNSNLVQEEVFDGNLCRRGRPALWTIWGRPRALQAARCLHALSFRALGRAAWDTNADRCLGLVGELAAASVSLALVHSGGPLAAGSTTVDPDRYLQAVAARSAALFACAAAGGARLALSDGEEGGKVVAGYRQFGLHLGVALRIADELEGAWGIESRSGTWTGSDIRKRKRTLPVVFAFHHAPERGRRVLRDLYSLTTCLDAEQETEVRQILAGCGAAAFARTQAEAHCERALSALRDARQGTEKIKGNRFLVDLAHVAKAVARRSAAVVGAGDRHTT